MKSRLILSCYLLFCVLTPSILLGLDAKNLEPIPALHDGRIKPLYAIAEVSYISVSGKKALPPGYNSPVQWLLDLSCNQKKALEAPIFPNSSLEIQKIIGSNDPYISWNKLENSLPKLYQDYIEAQKQAPEALTSYEKDLQSFLEKVFLFQALRNTLTIFDHETWERETYIYTKALELEGIKNLPDKITNENKELIDWYIHRYLYLSEAAIWHPLPPEGKDKEWNSIGASLINLSEKKPPHSLLPVYIDIVTAY